jgi:thiol-disulfide isomerase/thioredoxin
MGEKIKKTALIVLATLGVLFIIIMILPDDDSSDTSDAGEAAVVQEEAESYNEDEDTAEADDEDTADQEESEDDGNKVEVNIPSSELSKDKIKFKTVTLDNKKVSQKIFADYDLTIVHVWGTYCGPCIAEMGDYADLYKKLPDNINMVAIIVDVYDGLDSNVSDAKDILSDAGAKFTNLRVSDDVYSLISDLQYVPSTFFVDSEGHLVGEMLEGAGFSETKERLDSYTE